MTPLSSSEGLTLATILGVVGFVVGSFLGLVSLRVPAGEGLVFGRSRCRGCGLTLPPKHMVPVVSYLCLGGRCARCLASIPGRYPLIEAAAGAIGVIAGAVVPDVLAALSLALLGWQLLLAGVLFGEHRRLPAPLAAGLVISGVLVVVALQ